MSVGDTTARSLRDGEIKVQDGTTPTANSFTVVLEDGDLSWRAIPEPAVVIKDRQVLSHWRKGEEQPMEVSFTAIFQSLSYHAATTLHDALTQTDGASGWASTKSDTDVYTLDLVFTVSDPAGATPEILTFPDCANFQIEFAEGDPFDTYAVTCMSLATKPTIS